MTEFNNPSGGPSLPPSESDQVALPELSKELRSLFKELHCSQREFSNRVYLDHSGVSRYLRGTRLPPWEFIEILLKEVSVVRGNPVGSEEIGRIAALHRQALEERNGWSALVQLLQQDLHLAKEEIQRVQQEEDGSAIYGRSSYAGERWPAFVSFLRNQDWPETSIAKLELATARTVACLAEPTAVRPYRTSGVVVAGVQSGKTTIGAGIVARALDAGYRMVIVLAGNVNILHSQTQRRLNEALESQDAERRKQQSDPPLVRLTSEDSDYRPHLTANGLNFEKKNPSLPLFSPQNLYLSTPRLLVVKQNINILRKLLRDLQGVSEILQEVPTLIIDFDPSLTYYLRIMKNSEATSPIPPAIDIMRSQIVDLLPRAQLIRFESHVSYISTPILDPANKDSLWSDPPDFIISADPRGMPIA